MQEPYMSIAIKEAQKASKNGEVPVGAVIVDSVSDEIIATSGNLVEQNHLPIAHAEINVISKACEKLSATRLPNCDIYITLEPCPMCAYAISLARIRRLYFGAYDQKGGGVEHGPRIFDSTSCHHRPEIYGGICEEECADLLKNFFKELR